MRSVRLFVLLGSIALAACTAAPVAEMSADEHDDGTSAATEGRPVKEPGETTSPNEPGAPSSPSTATCASGPLPTVDTTALDPFFTAQMQKAKVPGLSVAVIGNGHIKWAKGYGLANIAKNEPVTTDTLFMLASVSKAITAVALMQLIEDPARGITLDQDVDTKLPFKVRNPRFPDVPITYRMLLTHTSSLVDSDGYWAVASPEPLVQGDSPIALLDFDRGYVAKADSWARTRPGTAYTYSNTGASLLGLLVEQIAGKNLQEWSKAKIFDPLGMNESSWFLRGLDTSHIAMGYQGTANSPTGHYGYPDYPAGQLRTSAPQLARFLLMFAQDGTCGKRVLGAATVKEIEKVQVPGIESSQGLVWYYDTKGGTNALGHNGGDKGVSSDMFFDPVTGNGYVLLSNGSTNVEGSVVAKGAMEAMNGKLMELARTLP